MNFVIFRRGYCESDAQFINFIAIFGNFDEISSENGK